MEENLEEKVMGIHTRFMYEGHVRLTKDERDFLNYLFLTGVITNAVGMLSVDIQRFLANAEIENYKLKRHPDTDTYFLTFNCEYKGAQWVAGEFINWIADKFVETYGCFDLVGFVHCDLYEEGFYITSDHNQQRSPWEELQQAQAKNFDLTQQVQGLERLADILDIQLGDVVIEKAIEEICNLRQQATT